MNVDALVRQVRGSSGWRTAREGLAHAIGRMPGAALEIAQTLDNDLARNGYDTAISALRHDAFVLACQSSGKAQHASPSG